MTIDNGTPEIPPKKKTRGMAPNTALDPIVTTAVNPEDIPEPIPDGPTAGKNSPFAPVSADRIGDTTAAAAGSHSDHVVTLIPGDKITVVKKPETVADWAVEWLKRRWRYEEAQREIISAKTKATAASDAMESAFDQMNRKHHQAQNPTVVVLGDSVIYIQRPEPQTKLKIDVHTAQKPGTPEEIN